MSGFLRFVGIANAALWFGTGVFFTVAVGPAFFSEAMLQLLGRPHAGAAAQVVLERYFVVHQTCAVVAILHLFGEALYSGRAYKRGMLGLLAGLLLLGFLGGYGIQPRLQSLHRTIYRPGTEEVAVQRARRSFAIWHAVSQVMNVMMIGGIVVHLVRLTRPPEPFRYQIRF